MKFFRTKAVLFFCLALSSLEGHEESLDPAFAGTLLSFYSKNVAPGHILIEPYFLLTSNYGVYNKDWSLKNAKNLYELEMLFILETGLTKFADVMLVLDGIQTWIGGKKTLDLSDTQVYLGFQMLEDKKGSRTPDFRLLLGENFPTGKYDNLDETKLLGDGIGSGSYETILGAVLQKAFYTQFDHTFFINFTYLYFIPTKTKVKEFNIFGGGLGTEGIVTPGQEHIFNLGLEYMLNKNWEISLDIRYDHQNSSKFEGEPGLTKENLLAPMGLPSSDQFSMAPSVEYHCNENFTVATGVWGSVFGRNSEAFGSFVLNLSFYY